MQLESVSKGQEGQCETPSKLFEKHKFGPILIFCTSAVKYLASRFLGVDYHRVVAEDIVICERRFWVKSVMAIIFEAFVNNLGLLSFSASSIYFR